MSGSSNTDAATVPEESGSTEAAPVVDGDATAAAQQPKTFLQKLQEIGYAPRELWIIYSIKFAESTAYFAFSYIYAPYLSDVFGFSDIEAGMLYAYYGVLCSVFGLLAGPVIDSLDLRSALLVGTIPSFAARFGSAVTDDPDFVSMCSISALPIGAAFGLPGVRARRAPLHAPREPRLRLHDLLRRAVRLLRRRRPRHHLCAHLLSRRADPAVAGLVDFSRGASGLDARQRPPLLGIYIYTVRGGVHGAQRARAAGRPTRPGQARLHPAAAVAHGARGPSASGSPTTTCVWSTATRPSGGCWCSL